MPLGEQVPMFLCIDVEPDDHPPAVGTAWSGFPHMVELLEGLRDDLKARSGVDPHPTWFFRMDPVITACYGSPCHVVEEHPEIIAVLRARDDPFGVHVHAIRWDADREEGYSDYADPEWPAHCVVESAMAFEASFGVRPTRTRQGGYFLSERVVDALVATGARVDLTVEPGLPALSADPSFGHHATGPSTSFVHHPREIYRPSLTDAGVPAGPDDEARPLTFVPLTSYDYRRRLRFRSWAKAQLLGRRPTYRPLSMWKEWPSPSAYWDLVERAIDRMERPYVAVAIRTYEASMPVVERHHAILRGLLDHRLGERLKIVDPLLMADG